MSQWYHRNGLKNTAKQNFYLQLTNPKEAVVRLCSDAREKRRRILDLVPDPSSSAEEFHELVLSYLTIIHGFAFNLRDSNPPTNGENGMLHQQQQQLQQQEQQQQQQQQKQQQSEQFQSSTHSSKVRNMALFKWSNSVTGVVEQQSDMIFEMASILYEYSMWLMKHASWIASQDSVDMESAKRVHSSLRRAAGLLQFIDTHLVEQLDDKTIVDGSDLDRKVITAYITTCQAEAQEVTIARAIELKHSSSLISALANQTAQLFQQSAASLRELASNKFFSKWLIYLQLKASVYLSYAYCYLGDNLLQQEECGSAVRALQESEKYLEKAMKIARDYSKFKSPLKGAMNAKIDEHLFFRNLRVLVTRIKEKCERENGFIYHHKVPEECPILELKATHGLVTPEEFTLPQPDSRWSSSVYSAFFEPPSTVQDKKKKSKETDNNKKKVDNEPVEEIVEKPIRDAKDQKNESGCSIQ